MNDPPTISNILISNCPERLDGRHRFTVGDVETAAASLTLTGASSNPTLVPGANIVFGGSGAARTVTVTPAANQSGTATITATVNDGTVNASDTFVLTVTVTNTAPTIADIADRSTNEDTSTGAIAFTMGDAETAVGSLTVTRASSNTTVVPLANVVLGGSGANRTVTVTPAANQSGTRDDHGDRQRRSAYGERYVRADRHRGERRAHDLEHPRPDNCSERLDRRGQLHGGGRGNGGSQPDADRYLE